jgi:hypothetical protein
VSAASKTLLRLGLYDLLLRREWKEHGEVLRQKDAHIKTLVLENIVLENGLGREKGESLRAQLDAECSRRGGRALTVGAHPATSPGSGTFKPW